MANQQEIFRHTIAGMKRATNRTDDASTESDDSIVKSTNRGNKLKRKARYAKQGHLNLADNPKAYRRRIDYNGYSRNIISRNPPLVDFDGDVVDSGDEGDSMQLETVEAEEDPYSEVKLENILMPLTSAADLPNHPSLSLPYTSRALEEMIRNAEDMLHRERLMLFKMKKVLAEFQGDDTWCEPAMYQTEQDVLMLARIEPGMSVTSPLIAEIEATAPYSANGDVVAHARQDTNNNKQIHNSLSKSLFANGSAKTEFSHVPVDQDNTGEVEMTNDDGQIPGSGNVQLVETATEASHGDKVMESHESNNNTVMENKSDQAGDSAALIDNMAEPLVNGETASIEETEVEQPQHRMTTRARAHAENSPSRTDSVADDTEGANLIHPFFLTPLSAFPDRLNGLQEPLASETRRILCAYVQKQEEICRETNTLYMGLLKAKRLRDSVFEWCVHEGHIHEMSDGEDWYDKNKWGLEEDLKKGEEVEDDDVGVSTGKKTRNRRAAAAAGG